MTMDKIEQQINSLNRKVDGIYTFLEHLSDKISDHRYSPSSSRASETEMIPSVPRLRHAADSNWTMETGIHHKDILNDKSDWENYTEPYYEKDLSPDIQIRRLTAQLTAAYNRIAALEEQILANRIHS